MIVLRSGGKNPHTHTMEQTKVNECRGDVEVCTDVTKILKMATAHCLQPSVWSQNISSAGRVHLPPPHAPAGANNVEQWGVWLCTPFLLEPLSPPLFREFREPRGWAKGGGALEPLNPASLHKEKTPGAQLRSCGWQATFQFLYPSSHPPTTWEPLPALMAPGWEPPIPLSQPRHLWKLGWAHTIKTSPLQAAGTLSSGERGAGTGEGCALPFVSNCLCS